MKRKLLCILSTLWKSRPWHANRQPIISVGLKNSQPDSTTQLPFERKIVLSERFINQKTMDFKIPSSKYNEQEELRTVGFELEFANVNIEQAIKIIQDLYGGEVQEKHRFHKKVTGTELGDFTIEIDLKLLNEKSYQKTLDKFNIDLQTYQVGENNLEFEVEKAMESIASSLIPYEIITPPVPVTEVEKFEKLRLSLFENDAKGTKDFLTNAFATHINIETPAKDVETIHNYVKAFLLLYPWIFYQSGIDLARRVSTFIAPFPTKYAELVIRPSYKPDLDTFIDDYHMYNPDRNRPLDMYPLLAHLRKEKVNSYQNLGNVKSRPTFHYRLPNSLIDQADWSLAKEWNYWVLIDDLANDKERLAQMSKEYMSVRQNTLLGFDKKWSKQTEQWLS